MCLPERNNSQFLVSCPPPALRVRTLELFYLVESVPLGLLDELLVCLLQQADLLAVLHTLVRQLQLALGLALVDSFGNLFQIVNLLQVRVVPLLLNP